MKPMENVFKGFGVALVTPFRQDGSVDYAALGHLVEMQLGAGVDFFCVLGSTAETPCLSNDEKLLIKDFVINLVRGRVPILLGFGGNCTRHLVDEARDFDFTGVDGLLSVCPFYNKPSQEGIFRHYEAFAAAVDLPIVAYNVPGRSGVNIEAATTLRMAREIPNLVAIKEASGYLSQIKKILEATPAGFSLISGDDALTYEMLTLGAGGVISVVGNALPALFGQMVHDAMAGKVSAAKDINIKLGEIYPLLSVDGNPAGIKALLSAMHLCENRLRLPLTPARAETCTQLQTIAKTF